jgi:hypothetical protein
MSVINDEDGQPGPLAQWALADPVRAVAVALIVGQLAWRAQIAARGFLAIDDFALISRAAGSRLGLDYLLAPFNNHLMPGGLLVTWLVTRTVGVAYWPYLLVLLALQAAVDIALLRLFRRMLRPGWAMLVPLALFLFNPLTLEASSWWAVGVNLLPMQLSMVLAASSHLSYLSTRRWQPLVRTVLAILFGLVFFEKSLLVVPLLLLLTACLYARGGPVRSGWTTIRQYWPAWLVLLGASIGYLTLYLSRAPAVARQPSSATEVVTFLRQLFGSTVLPGLLGGPWQWLPASDDGAPVAAPGELARWLAWAGVLALMAGTVLVRRSAARAWLLLYMYLGLVAGLIGSTRLGSGLSSVAGLFPRYVGDVVVVAAICLGAALLGVAAPAPEQPADLRLLPGALRRPEVVAGALVATIAGYLLSAGWTSARFGDDWADKQGRGYLRTAMAEVAAAPPGTVFFDQPVPSAVVSPLSAPYHLQSRFFAPLSGGPRFVTATPSLSMLDDAGHVRPGRVAGPALRPAPRPVPGCGYRVTGGRTATIPLQGTLFDWRWAVRIGYVASGDTLATFRFGGAAQTLPVEPGRHQYFLLLEGGGSAVELTLDDPSVTLCTNEITVGNPEPAV